MTKNRDNIQKFYSSLKDKVDYARKFMGQPLTLSEKILCSHLWEKPMQELVRGRDYVDLTPDRVAMQDATAQMALLQFMHAGKSTTAVPTTVHCDHLIEAEISADTDLSRALKDNKEVYDFLSSISLKYGIDCWKPGAGIIHQVILENYAFPGGLMIGSDSHTPNAGGLGMMGVGVGGADAVDVMSGMSWELKFPKVTGVHLTGKLNSWVAPKDVILHLLGLLTVKGGTGHVFEYFGEGARNISCTGKATICNMGAELGATSSVFPYDKKMAEYLKATGRADVASMADELAAYLAPDKQVLDKPGDYYDRVIEVNLSELEPYLNGPFTPDLAWPLSRVREAALENGYPVEVSAGLVGSCTNSSYEDIDKAASIARDALQKGIKPKGRFYLSPGSTVVCETIRADGQLKTLEDMGGVLLANACGPCIGMWNRTDMPMGQKNTIVTSFNRNFAKRADGNPGTHAFVASPEMVTALAIAGRLDFDPRKDTVLNEKGKAVKLSAPRAQELPRQFAAPADTGIIQKSGTGDVEVIVDPESERLQLLAPFAPWDGRDIENAAVLVKIKGKCTTDHISMAGEWLKFRGHLDNISNNLLIGAANAFTGEIGKTVNINTGSTESIPAAARAYKAAGIPWVIIGDENYGEGSSREHAAMEPRYLGGRAVIVRSFARIHETNLKKQGMLALTFADPEDYEKIAADDRLSIKGLADFRPGVPLKMEVLKKDGSALEITLNHTYNEGQIDWFKAGSALNLIAHKNKNS